ncbi:translocase of chloroplast 120, chloroplastic-like isoform X1 [Primulina eburnea]|uniref:translocase of chloroplast 120, chloroplastic-like isoform X1 n=2 Tax=Primulina eburnea TaxID=1245227 RepID=UPI003C6C8749
MENDYAVVDVAKLEETQGSKSQIFEPTVKDNVAFSMDGSKESDEDEVFEEAEPTMVDSDKSVKTEDEKIESSGIVESDKENTNLVSDAEEDEHLMNENNGTVDDGVVEDGKDDSVEIADSTTFVAKSYSSLPESLQNVEDAVPETAISFKTLTSDDAEDIADAGAIKEEIRQMSEPPEAEELQGAEMNPEKPDLKGSIHEISEIQDANEVKGGDASLQVADNGIKSDVNLGGTLNHKGIEISYTDSVKEQSNDTSAETRDANGSIGSEVCPKPVSESNGDILRNSKPNLIVNERVIILGSDYQGQQTERIPTNSLSESEEDHAGEQENGQMIIESGSVEVAKSDILDVVSGESKCVCTVDISPGVSSDVAEGSEMEGANDGKMEKCCSGSRGQEVGSVTGISSSSSGNTSTPRPSPVLPAVTEPHDLVQEPLFQGNSVKRKQEKISEAAVSSANSISPQSTSLGQTALPVKPAPSNSGNKEHGSRSASDIPPSNSNLASTRPAGLGRAAPLLEPTSRVVQQPRVNGAVSPMQNQLIEDPANGEAEEYDETREKLQMIRVKFLRLAHRLGQTPHNVVVAQVLYRLGLAEQLQGRSGGRVAAFSFDRASAVAEQLEAAGQEPLDFTCTIMVIGKTGVGKSATINSIFDEVMFGTDAFQFGTKKVQDIVGTVQGIRVRVIDTPGLLPSWSDQCQNEKILHSVKKFIKKTPPDIVLYLDRLDMPSRDFGDMPLLRTITEIFGPSLWFNAIVVLTHAASAPPEGPNGTATSYDTFVTQRSYVVQQAIRQAAGDMRLMNPVSLVENHSACRTNRAGQRVLPNGQVWKPHLLLLSFASKILAEANTLLKLQDGPPGKSFAPRTRSPPLPFLLSSLLQSRPEVKLPSEQFGDDDDIIDDLDDSSDSDSESSEYDELPPFRSLSKAQLEKLNKVQRKAYYDELEYRERLFMKKQLKEEKQQRKMAKKIQEEAKNLPADSGENEEEEASAAASVPIPMPDLALPASFDSDNPTHRYRSLDSSNPWLVRAVLEPNGWDHDIGYDGVNVERLFVVKDKVPVSFSGQLSKDKKDGNLQMEVASSVKHGKGKATSLGFDMQSVGKDFAYTLRTETRFSNHRLNKAVAGLSATLLGDVWTGGLKLEDKLLFGKRGQLVVSGGAMYGRGDVAYGGSLEATLRDKDHHLGHFLSTLGISVMDWHGDLAIGCNFHTQIPIGRHENLVGRINLNNKGSGQMSVRVNSSEQLQIVLIGLIPLVKKVLSLSQPVQYG